MERLFNQLLEIKEGKTKVLARLESKSLNMINVQTDISSKTCVQISIV